jgi:hypothetical protein
MATDTLADGENGFETIVSQLLNPVASVFSAHEIQVLTLL